MIRIFKHIETLLLDNDCVIIPDFGGFVAHYAEAHYDERDNSFLPPMRMLGFNQHLKLNDSLLVQSYIDAYDMSYPEALHCITDEVEEIKKQLQDFGSYEIENLGTLSAAGENIIFEPVESGLLSPSLYGLSSFVMPARDCATSIFNQPEAASELNVQPIESQIAYDNSDTDSNVIKIKVSWIRNVAAVAAAVLFFFLLTTPVTNDSNSNLKLSGISFNFPENTIANSSAASSEEIQKATAGTETAASAADETEETVVEEDIDKKAEANDYCIVLASCISKKNAERFVTELKNNGYEKAYVYENNNITRVVYGSYASESEAYNDLRIIHGNKKLKQSWVYKIK